MIYGQPVTLTSVSRYPSNDVWSACDVDFSFPVSVQRCAVSASSLQKTQFDRSEGDHVVKADYCGRFLEDRMTLSIARHYSNDMRGLPALYAVYRNIFPVPYCRLVPPAVWRLKIQRQSLGIDKDISGPSAALITLLKEKGLTPVLGNGRARQEEERIYAMRGGGGGVSALEGRGCSSVKTQRGIGGCC